MAAQNNIVVVIAAQDNSKAVLDQVASSLNDVKQKGESAGDSIASIAGKAAGIVSLAAIARRAAGALLETVTSSLALGTQLQSLSQRTGLSIGTLSTLNYASKMTGGSLEQSARAVARLDKTIGDAASGNKQASAALSAIGVSAKDLAGRTDGAEVALRALGKRLADTSGPNKQTIAMHLLGKGGGDLLPVLLSLANGWDTLREQALAAGMQFDGTTAEQLAHSNRMLTDMKFRVEGAGVAFTRGLTPGINAVLRVIADGKGNMDAMVDFGNKVGRVMAFAEAAAYGLASGLEQVMAAVRAVGSDHNLDQASMDKAKYYDQKARAARFFALNGREEHPDTTPDPLTPKEQGAGHGGIPPVDTTASKMESAVKQRDASLAKLDEASAQERYQRVKESTETQLAALESAHKQELVSDAEFYQQKLDLQRQALDAQKEALQEKQGAIDANIMELQANAAKHGGRLLVDTGKGTVTAASGHAGDAVAVADEAKIADLLAKRLELVTQIGQVATATAKVEHDYATEAYELEKKQLDTADKLAVERESAAGRSVTARLKQSADQYADERKPLDLQLDAAMASGEIEAVRTVLMELQAADENFTRRQAAIRAQGADEYFGLSSAELASQRAGIAGAQARGGISSADARSQNHALDQQAATDMERLQQAYQKLADAGDLQATEKVMQLGVQIRELRDPVDQAAAHIREEFDSAFEGLFENLDRGRKEWKSFAKDLQRIMLREAYTQMVEPSVQSGLGKVFANGGGGVPMAHQAIGAQLAGMLPGFGKPFSEIAGRGASAVQASATPTIQIINNSSQPVQGSATSQNADLTETLRPAVTQIFLEDLNSGGTIGQALSGLGGLLT